MFSFWFYFTYKFLLFLILLFLMSTLALYQVTGFPSGTWLKTKVVNFWVIIKCLRGLSHPFPWFWLWTSAKGHREERMGRRWWINKTTEGEAWQLTRHVTGNWKSGVLFMPSWVFIAQWAQDRLIIFMWQQWEWVSTIVRGGCCQT